MLFFKSLAEKILCKHVWKERLKRTREYINSYGHKCSQQTTILICEKCGKIKEI